MLQDDGFARCLGRELSVQTLSRVSWEVRFCRLCQASGGPHGHNGAITKLRQSGLGPGMDEQGGEGRGPGGGQMWDE